MNWWPTVMLGAQKGMLDPRSFAIATFACADSPTQFDRHSDWRHQRSGAEQAGELAKLGFRAMIAGHLGQLMSPRLWASCCSRNVEI